MDLFLSQKQVTEPGTPSGERNEAPPLEGRTVKELWAYFKTATQAEPGYISISSLCPPEALSPIPRFSTKASHQKNAVFSNPHVQDLPSQNLLRMGPASTLPSPPGMCRKMSHVTHTHPLPVKTTLDTLMRLPLPQRTMCLAALWTSQSLSSSVLPFPSLSGEHYTRPQPVSMPNTT